VEKQRFWANGRREGVNSIYSLNGEKKKKQYKETHLTYRGIGKKEEKGNPSSHCMLSPAKKRGIQVNMPVPENEERETMDLPFASLHFVRQKS